MDTSDLVITTKMPHATVKNVLTGRSVRPATLGRIAKALNVDPEELLEASDYKEACYGAEGSHC